MSVRKTTASVVLLAVFLVSIARADDAAANTADIYRRAFAVMPKLSESEANLLRGQSSDADAMQLSQKLAPALALFRQAARVENCDWGLDLAQTGPATEFSHLQPLRQLANAAAWEANRVKQSDPTAFSSWHEDVLLSSVHAGQGDALICGLVEAQMRLDSIKAISSNLAALPPEMLAKIRERLNVLPQLPSLSKILLAEKTAYLDWLMRQIFELQRTQQAVAAAASFAVSLRLTAVVSGGPVGLKIGLEEQDGDNFWLGLGQRKRGIELISADVKNGRAVLLKGNQAAVVLLREKRIEPINLKVIQAALKKVMGSNALKEFLDRLGNSSTEFVKQLLEASDIMEAAAASATTPVKDPELWAKQIASNTTSNVFADEVLIANVNARSLLDVAQARELMLRMAVDIAREGPSAIARSRDPWADGAPFVLRATPDGYELVSQLLRKGENVTLRFPRR